MSKMLSSSLTSEVAAGLTLESGVMLLQGPRGLKTIKHKQTVKRLRQSISDGIKSGKFSSNLARTRYLPRLI